MCATGLKHAHFQTRIYINKHLLRHYFRRL
nr:MAG TPA: hypothetical protein [Caudoviricetes sp.]